VFPQVVLLIGTTQARRRNAVFVAEPASASAAAVLGTWETENRYVAQVGYA
jgi:hypothetical protein